MKLTDFLSRECLRVPLEATEKWGVIRELIDLLDAQGRLTDKQRVLGAVVERERARSTGMEFGLAVPHARSEGCPAPAMALGLCRPPIDFGSMDGEPTWVVFLLVAPLDQTGSHIQALARVSRLMLADRFREALAACTTAEQVYTVIAEHGR